jgi:putative tricarboxylic transport membrane protein
VGRDRWSAVGLALLAIGYLLAGRRYPLDTLDTPGPGVVPVLAGLALLGVAIWLFVVAGSVSPARAAGGPINRSALVLAAALVVYAALLPRLGFLASSFSLVVVASRLMGAAGWWRPVALAVGVTGGCYLLFARWLGVPLP